MTDDTEQLSPAESMFAEWAKERPWALYSEHPQAKEAQAAMATAGEAALRRHGDDKDAAIAETFARTDRAMGRLSADEIHVHRKFYGSSNTLRILEFNRANPDFVKQNGRPPSSLEVSAWFEENGAAARAARVREEEWRALGRDAGSFGAPQPMPQDDLARLVEGLEDHDAQAVSSFMASKPYAKPDHPDYSRARQTTAEAVRDFRADASPGGHIDVRAVLAEIEARMTGPKLSAREKYVAKKLRVSHGRYAAAKEKYK